MNTSRNVYRAAIALADGRTFVTFLRCESWIVDANVLSDVLRARVIAVEMEDATALLCSTDAFATDVLRCKRALQEDEHQHRPADKANVAKPVGAPVTVPQSFIAPGGQS